MNYRILGRTGIKVSEIGIGGEGFENRSYEDCEALIDCAMKNGINFIDVYNSNPEVRSHHGRALKKYPRDAFVIQGHLCTVWDDGQYRRSRELKEIVPAFMDLLERMQLNYIDVGMIHYVDEKSDFERIMSKGIIAYAQELKRQGHIKALGLSTHNPDIALMAVESGLIDVILLSINPAYDMLPASEDVDILFEDETFANRTYEGIDPKREHLYQLCENRGVALTVMKGYAAGKLFSQAESPFGQALTPVQCLHYALTRPAVAAVMVGVSSQEQLLAAAAYATASDAEKDYSEILANAPKSSFRGHCMYCGHCAPCSQKIDIAAVNKYLDLALIQETVPETVNGHYELLAHYAEECIAYGECLKNCPFGVAITDRMKQAVAVFGK
ncbi:aldo/keto reductase [Acetobacterium wieringae]|uniref:Aldo/keto reductase n=1 Tax=Acetobacterium wieringae TaxID=52694 RepID=A0A5D0WJ19_9FIRM|nr:aldo/keto reductase [Acetobacterium wieringae]TYC83658.1 aldo/keto reductase [Acetobacterium wieringae]